MNFYRFLLVLPVFLTLKMSLCHYSIILTSKILGKNNHQGVTMYDSIRHDDFCSYFYSIDTLNDTLHFNFEDREDFGPVYLSINELKQIYGEIKRGNIKAYKVLLLHYFYRYSPCIQKSDLEKLICITDYLAQKYHYYEGYYISGNIINDYLDYNADDYYSATMINYYENYFEFSKSIRIAQKLYDIYCGNYSFHDKDSIKARYYEEFVQSK